MVRMVSMVRMVRMVRIINGIAGVVGVIAATISHVNGDISGTVLFSALAIINVMLLCANKD